MIKIKLSAVFLPMCLVFLSQTAQADISAVKTETPSQALLHAVGANADKYTLNVMARMSTALGGTYKKVSTCRVNIPVATIDCPGLGWAMLEIVKYEIGETAAYFNLMQMQIDPAEVAPGENLQDLTIVESDVHLNHATFKPNGWQPEEGQICYGGGIQESKGTSCEILEDRDGNQTERCCPATQEWMCKKEGEDYKWTKVGETVDKTSDQCTYRPLPSDTDSPEIKLSDGFPW